MSKGPPTNFFSRYGNNEMTSATRVEGDALGRVQKNVAQEQLALKILMDHRHQKQWH
jgi:hypothetical protein